MIATSSQHASGWTSGVGLAIANTIASGAIVRTASARERAGRGDADDDVRARQRVVRGALQAARVRALGHLRAARR